MPSPASPQTSAAKKFASATSQQSAASNQESAICSEEEEEAKKKNKKTTTTYEADKPDLSSKVARARQDKQLQTKADKLEGRDLIGQVQVGHSKELPRSSAALDQSINLGRIDCALASGRCRDTSGRTAATTSKVNQPEQQVSDLVEKQQTIDSSRGGGGACEQIAVQVESDSDNCSSAKKRLDQRIKVTLSAPSNSSGGRQSEQPILETSCVLPGERGSTSRAGRTEEGSIVAATGNCGVQKPAERQFNQERLANSRLERENELRRIAAQRTSRLKQQTQEQSVFSTSTSIATSLNELQLKTNQGTQEKATQQKQRPQQVAPVPPNPKQLAVYINGNIRSNSIFCQSSSLSQSFNNILNRFSSQSSSSPNKEEGSLKLKIDDKQSPLRLSHHHKHNFKSAKHKGAKNNSNASGKVRCHRRATGRSCEQHNHKTKGPRLVANLRSSAVNLFRDWHLLPNEGNQERQTGKPSLRLKASGSDQSELPILREPLSSSNGDRWRRASSSSPVLEGGSGDKGLAKEAELNRYQDSLSTGSSCNETTSNKPNYKLNPSSMFLRKAMRYYRLWIYCTNILIFFGALIFILAAIYVTSDYRIKLLVTRSQTEEESLGLTVRNGRQHENEVPGLTNNRLTPTRLATTTASDGGGSPRQYDIHISYSEPCVIIVYAVIAIQAGVLQVFGCIGAIRMKEKWIQAYWYTILALCALDLVFVIYWGYRYKSIIASLHQHMSTRLNQHYGHFSNYSTPSFLFQPDHLNAAFPSKSVSLSSASLLVGDSYGIGELGASSNQLAGTDQVRVHEHEDISLKLDKILTEIIDRIQTESQCCGISSSLDYRRSRWRKAKLEQLGARLNWSQTEERDLLRRVPLVPASCCRPPPDNNHRSGANEKPVILDDSQLAKPMRVPAWSPSMAVEDLQVANMARKRQRAKTKASEDARLEGTASGKVGQAGEGQPEGGDSGHDADDKGSDDELEDDGQTNKQVFSLEDLIDQRWTSGASLEGGEQQLSKQQRRLLAKQRHFNQQRRPQPDAEQAGLLVQSRTRRFAVESSVDEQERVLSRIIEGSDFMDADSMGDCGEPDRGEATNTFKRPAKPSNKSRLAALREMLFTMGDHQQAGGSSSFERDNFKWPNKVQLSFEQYKIIEEYLLANEDENQDEADSLSSLPIGAARVRQRRHNNWLSLESGQQPVTKSQRGEEPSRAKELRDTLVATLLADPETSCAPRSYYDHASIYTRGCQTAIENWIESSMNVLFVAGVCVLCFVKLCSLFMLRFEIREMIHKIRVLKGMATEYNALQDLEAYLPRPSVCAQAAELTPSGVTAAGGGSISGASGVPPPIGLHRLGGSFSEAVAAAAAAQSGRMSPTSRLGLGGLANSGRAASMKAVAAMSCMLQPGLCPRSSSVSAAHLQAASWLSNISQAGAGCASGAGVRKLSSLRSNDPFSSTSPVFSRRHTAISVCPAAAANAAAAAAHHLMARRGTYVANPVFGQLGPLRAPGMPANPAEHRHSAQLLSPPCSSGCAAAKPAPHECPAESNSSTQQANRHSFEHQSSAESANLGKQQPQQPQPHQCRTMIRLAQANTGSHQLLSLVCPFKRQSSGGAQSACNFSLDIAPPGGLLESRRSIH